MATKTGKPELCNQKIKNRFMKVGNKIYQDKISGLFIYEQFSAAEFGLAVWVVSHSKDGKEVAQGLFKVKQVGCKFNDCKTFLKNNFND